MLIGEKPPAVAPLMTIRPIRTGLILKRTAKLSAIGTMIATAAGTTEPTAVRTPVTAKKTHGISTTRPPTSRTAAATSQSTVPLLRASANR